MLTCVLLICGWGFGSTLAAQHVTDVLFGLHLCLLSRPACLDRWFIQECSNQGIHPFAVCLELADFLIEEFFLTFDTAVAQSGEAILHGGLFQTGTLISC